MKKDTGNTDIQGDAPFNKASILKGLLANEFYLTYQPQINADSGELVGMEALMRWDSSVMGMVNPESFIRIAEESEAIDHIWAHILETVSNDRKVLDEKNQQFLHLSINLSATQLPQPGLAEQFADWLKQFQIDGAQVHIEITESSLLADTPVVTENLTKLSQLDVNLWLDDFGTGFSSLRHLRDLPITGLKIDKSFISDLENNLDDFRIVSAIIAMSNSLGLKTVAEGVETKEQAQMLTQLGCDILQGYFFGKPERLDQVITDWIDSKTE